MDLGSLNWWVSDHKNGRFQMGPTTTRLACHDDWAGAPGSFRQGCCDIYNVCCKDIYIYMYTCFHTSLKREGAKTPLKT